ncbi:MAG: M14 family metallopeptidase [Chitinophagaceae bacterium]
MPTTNLFKTYHFDSNHPGPHLLISAGVHGDEYEPMIAANKLIQTATSFLTKGSVTIAPVVNRSAFSLASRCGTDGLDLARTCPGKKEGSITEEVANEISLLIQQSDFFIDMHTGGTLFNIFPLAGYMLHDSPEVLKHQQNMAEAFNLPVIWGTDKYAEGRTLSVARDANIPAIYVEYGGGISASTQIIDAYFQGCLNVMRYLNMTDSVAEHSTYVHYWVDDYRIDSGHLQTKMPSTSMGIFFPAVKPGDQVQKGYLWGLVINPEDGSENKMIADVDGLVLFTRISSHVNTGESLGGILPITKPGKKIFNAVIQ